MKTKADLIKSWLRKAESDLTNTRLCVSAGTALDTACFHAQQATEKFLKAYLTAHETSFPFVHNLEKLIELCIHQDPSFASMKALAEELTPYAVELRYDDEFWPSKETAHHALEAALSIRDFVLSRLPSEFQPKST